MILRRFRRSSRGRGSSFVPWTRGGEERPEATEDKRPAQKDERSRSGARSEPHPRSPARSREKQRRTATRARPSCPRPSSRPDRSAPEIERPSHAYSTQRPLSTKANDEVIPGVTIEVLHLAMHARRRRRGTPEHGTPSEVQAPGTTAPRARSRYPGRHPERGPGTPDGGTPDGTPGFCMGT